MARIEVFGIEGLPEIAPGDDLGILALRYFDDPMKWKVMIKRVMRMNRARMRVRLVKREMKVY